MTVADTANHSHDTRTGDGAHGPTAGSMASGKARWADGTSDHEASVIRERLARLGDEKAALEARLAELEAAMPGEQRAPYPTGPITNRSAAHEKIALYRSLFRGREDVFPKRWENARTSSAGYAPACGNEWVPGLCDKPRIKYGACSNQAFLAVTDEVIAGHLMWDAIRSVFIPCFPTIPVSSSPPTSTSGNGGGMREPFSRYAGRSRFRRRWNGRVRAMAGTPGSFSRTGAGYPRAPSRRPSADRGHGRNPDIGFESYDRFFPSQDTLPAGGFDNLIALPLERVPRENGNSLFLDDGFEPWADQWKFLSSLRRLPLAEASGIVDEAGRMGRIVGLRLPVEDEDEEPWTAPPSRHRPLPSITAPLPERIDPVLGDRIYVPRAGLPPALVNRLIRLAAFQNPAFYIAQAMHRTWAPVRS